MLVTFQQQACEVKLFCGRFRWLLPAPLCQLPMQSSLLFLPVLFFVYVTSYLQLVSWEMLSDHSLKLVVALYLFVRSSKDCDFKRKLSSCLRLMPKSHLAKTNFPIVAAQHKFRTVNWKKCLENSFQFQFILLSLLKFITSTNFKIVTLTHSDKRQRRV